MFEARLIRSVLTRTRTNTHTHTWLTKEKIKRTVYSSLTYFITVIYITFANLNTSATESLTFQSQWSERAALKVWTTDGCLNTGPACVYHTLCSPDACSHYKRDCKTFLDLYRESFHKHLIYIYTHRYNALSRRQHALSNGGICYLTTI